MLAQISVPTRGSVKVHGKVAPLIEVGAGLIGDLTGRENVFLNGAILGMSRQEIQSKFDEIVQFAEVERFLDTPVKRYSSGMYVRLAFAVAAHLDPEIMIVDEVLAVGDAQFQKKCLGRMEEVGRSGRTVIFVSHNVAAVRQLCETAIYLQNGQLIAHSNVEDAISRYMEHGSEDASYKVWSKGVGEGILLCEAEVCGSSGSRRAEFSANEDINLRFGVKVERFTKEARIGFRLMSLDGTIIFTSEDSDTLKLSTSYGVGDHQLSATIPAGLLNEGVYSVTAGAHVPNDRILFFEESVLRFRVNASGALGSETPATRLGFIRPRLNWTLA